MLLSGIQHFAFCRRQWALIYIEQQWEENLRTIDGRIMHERAHDGCSSEKRGGSIVTRSMPVISATLGGRGVCDVVEFHEDPDGVKLHGRRGRYKPIPVEYKRAVRKCMMQMFFNLRTGNLPCGDVGLRNRKGIFVLRRNKAQRRG